MKTVWWSACAVYTTVFCVWAFWFKRSEIDGITMFCFCFVAYTCWRNLRAAIGARK